MAYEQKNLSGSLFTNMRKEKETHPDWTGTAKIDGKDYWISGWNKKDKSGDTYFSLSFKSKEERADLREASKPKSQKQSAPIEDEVPW